MASAIRAAVSGSGRASPNPLVGAALVFPDGRILARGHLRFGGPHAEARVLQAAREEGRVDARGRLPRGTRLYVTLEPCAHRAKTGPCVDLVREARPHSVTVALADPDPRVRGRGIRLLRDAGFRVEVGQGAADVLALNFAYHLRHALSRSLVRVKLGASLDARLGTGRGGREWITGEESRKAVHAERAAADAVVVGAATVLADDPELNVRHVRGPQPSRIVIDSSLRTPARARVAGGRQRPERPSEPLGGMEFAAGNYAAIVAPGPAGGLRYVRRERLILATRRGWPESRTGPYRRAGWEVWELPGDSEGRVSLRALFRRSAREGFLRLLAEAGPRLAGGLFAEDLVDELSLYQAPVVLGGPAGWPAGWAAGSVTRARHFALVRGARRGADLWSLYVRDARMREVERFCSLD